MWHDAVQLNIMHNANGCTNKVNTRAEQAQPRKTKREQAKSETTIFHGFGAIKMKFS